MLTYRDTLRRARPRARQLRPQNAGWTPWLLTGGAILFAWFSLWHKLSADWSVNDQYQYGWFVPPLAFALLALRWSERPPAAPGSHPSGWTLGLLAGGCLLLLGPVRLTEEPNPDWRLLFWLHIALLVAISFALLLWTGGLPWMRHFAFPVGFLVLAVPWPSGLEQAIVQSLMRVVAAVSAEVMNISGIPALAQGNLIHIRDQIVGVDEACSGIRSLQTMLMAGLLLGELSHLNWLRRLILLAGGFVLAMLANIFRSSLLVWIAARHGIAVLERFHDSAGVSVLLIVFAGLLWITRLLSRGRRPPGDAALENAPRPPSSSGFVRAVPKAAQWAAIVWLAFIEVGTVAWYGMLAPTRDKLPRWTVAPPTGAPGFQYLKIDSRTGQLLRFDQGLAARWTEPQVPKADCTLFFFRWEAGHASAAQAEMHQPHICLTAGGLTQIADWGIHPLPLPGGITLPVRRYEFSLHGNSIYVFFVVSRDRGGGQPLAEVPGTRWDRLLAVREHRPNLGQQTLEFVVGGPVTAAQAAERFEREAAAMVRPVTFANPAGTL